MVMMSQATTGTRRLMPVMAALPSRETAVPRRRTNQRLTTALATTGPTAARPREARTPYTSASCQRLAQSPVKAREAARTTQARAQPVREATDPGHEESVEKKPERDHQREARTIDAQIRHHRR